MTGFPLKTQKGSFQSSGCSATFSGRCVTAKPPSMTRSGILQEHFEKPSTFKAHSCFKKHELSKCVLELSTELNIELCIHSSQDMLWNPFQISSFLPPKRLQMHPVPVQILLAGTLTKAPLMQRTPHYCICCFKKAFAPCIFHARKENAIW